MNESMWGGDNYKRWRPPDLRYVYYGLAARLCYEIARLYMELRCLLATRRILGASPGMGYCKRCFTQQIGCHGLFVFDCQESGPARKDMCLLLAATIMDLALELCWDSRLARSLDCFAYDLLYYFTEYEY